MIEPEDRWEPWRVTTCLTGGPERIYDDSPTTDHPRPAGFTASQRNVEPLLWEGDNA